MTSLSVLISVLAFAQVASAAPPVPVEQDRLRVCLDEARTDPPTAITSASRWLNEANGAEASLPQQCLGFAYTALLRWGAAEQAFIASRDLRPENDQLIRARLGAMAGNAALADERAPRAAELFETAQFDAEAEGETQLAGQIAADRARALVQSDRTEEAQSVLEGAQVLAPQTADVWLLSATLARRDGDIAKAAPMIEAAAKLAPDDPSIGLELGLIAALAGDDEAARRSWQNVVSLAPQSPQSQTARAYLARLDSPSEAQ